MKTKLMWILVGIAALGLYAGTAAAAAARDATVPNGARHHVPKICQRPHLSKEIQRFCDQLQFADVPHYHVVRHAHHGVVRSIHLIDTVTGREVFTSYPYGIRFATPDQSDSELRMKTEELAGVLEGLPTPAEAAPEGFAIGLPIGWNNFTGRTPSRCRWAWSRRSASTTVPRRRRRRCRLPTSSR
jgi:hypothetical protein